MKKIIRLIVSIATFLISLPSILAINATKSRYDLTNTSKVSDLYGFVVEVNKLTDQVFMTGILLVSFIILFVGFRDKGTDDALLGAGFITSVITILFTSLNFVPRWVAILIIAPYALFFAYRMVRT